MSVYRRGFYPGLPRTVEDLIHLPGDWSRTLTGHRFHRVTNAEKNYCIFTSKEQIQALALARTIYADGTFSSVPLPFGRGGNAAQGQFYVISGIVNNRAVTLAYILMRRKTKGKRSLKRILKKSCNNFQQFKKQFLQKK